MLLQENDAGPNRIEDIGPVALIFNGIPTAVFYLFERCQVRLPRNGALADGRNSGLGVLVLSVGVNDMLGKHPNAFGGLVLAKHVGRIIVHLQVRTADVIDEGLQYFRLLFSGFQGKKRTTGFGFFSDTCDGLFYKLVNRRGRVRRNRPNMRSDYGRTDLDRQAKGLLGLLDSAFQAFGFSKAPKGFRPF